MSPYALRQRMRHGNVYPPERTAIALDQFFTESNLTALRELACASWPVASTPSSRGSARPAVPERHRARPRARRRRHRRRRARCAVRLRRPRVLRAPLLAVVVETPGAAGASSEQDAPHPRAPRRRDRPRRRDPDRRGIRRRGGHRPIAGTTCDVAGHRRTRTSTALERVRKSPLTERILERLPTLEVTIVADARERPTPSRSAAATDLGIRMGRVWYPGYYQSTAWRDPTPTHTLCRAAGRTLPLNTTGNRTVEMTCRARL